VVDTLLGQHQTVIKPLGRLFRSLRGISGSSILGNGEVALIFDVARPWPGGGARRARRSAPGIPALPSPATTLPEEKPMNHSEPSWIARLLAGAELDQAKDRPGRRQHQPAAPRRAGRAGSRARRGRAPRRTTARPRWPR
jgi:hypothetical protein